MIAPNYFIIRPKNGIQYVQKKSSGIIESTGVEDVSNIQRLGEIVNVPYGYKGIAQEMDECILNHNIFRIHYNDKGVPVYSDSYFKDDLFYVDPELIYAVIKNDEIICLDHCVFVQPVYEEVFMEGKVDARQIGILKHGNSITKKLGLKNGTKVLFKIFGEHKYDLNNETVYRMATSHILAVLN